MAEIVGISSEVPHMAMIWEFVPDRNSGYILINDPINYTPPLNDSPLNVPPFNCPRAPGRAGGRGLQLNYPPTLPLYLPALNTTLVVQTDNAFLSPKTLFSICAPLRYLGTTKDGAWPR